MSYDNIINNVIKDNIKISEKQDIKNEINKEDNDISFNQLLNLQILIQKHSGLKELCKFILYLIFKYL